MWSVKDYDGSLSYEEEVESEFDEREEVEYEADDDRINLDEYEPVPGLSDYDHVPNMEYNIPEKSTFLLEYVRKSNREKKGVLMAVKQDGRVLIGWSLCKSFDYFDKYFGQEIAFDRGVKRFYDPYHFEKIPASITDQMDRFIERCVKYFKDCEFPQWAF